MKFWQLLKKWFLPIVNKFKLKPSYSSLLIIWIQWLKGTVVTIYPRFILDNYKLNKNTLKCNKINLFWPSILKSNIGFGYLYPINLNL